MTWGTVRPPPTSWAPSRLYTSLVVVLVTAGISVLVSRLRRPPPRKPDERR
jgi:hypothetical protein